MCGQDEGGGFYKLRAGSLVELHETGCSGYPGTFLARVRSADPLVDEVGDSDFAGGGAEVVFRKDDVCQGDCGFLFRISKSEGPDFASLVAVVQLGILSVTSRRGFARLGEGGGDAEALGGRNGGEDLENATTWESVL